MRRWKPVGKNWVKLKTSIRRPLISTGRVRRAALLASATLLVGVMLQPCSSRAQVVTNITSSGLGTTITQAGTTYNITGGARPGNGPNLFHSFGLFNIGAGDTGNFSNGSALATTNILGRVTDGQVSNIFGKIQTSGFGTANLFLMNPAGWIFGATASLNVGGAFHVSTADYIRFPDVDGVQVRFTADTSDLPANGLTANPIAFGFLSANPTRISVNSSTLEVATGQTLSLVGGEAAFAGEAETGLNIAGVAPGSATPTLRAPSGRVQIISVASPGEVTLNPDVSLFETLGRIDLTNGARIDVSGVAGPGGTVVIRGGQLFASQSARVLANTTGNVNGASTAVDVQVSGDMVLAGASGIEVRTSGSGAAGDARVVAGSLELSGSSFISSVTSNGGAGGDIVIDVGSLTLNDGGAISSTSDLIGGLSGGPGGDITITATGPVSSDGAAGGISAITRSALLDETGTGGRVSISAPSLALDNGARVTISSNGTGAAGELVIDVGTLTMANGATLRSRTINAPGANVTVTATDSVEISGSGSGIFSGSSGTGAVGEIAVDTAQLTLTGGVIQSGTSLDPGGGNVTVNATDSIFISEGGGISSQARSQPVGQVAISTADLVIDNGFISTSTVGIGRAGDITVNAAILTLLNGGQIASSSNLSASGDGGNVNITATNSISISGTIPPDFVLDNSDPRQFSGDPRSGIFSTSFESGSGGNIAVQAGQTVELASEGTISAQSLGTGNAGQISVTAPTLTLDGATISVATDLEGAAGNILLNVSTLTLTGAARISSSTFGDGAGGTVEVTAGELVSISGVDSGLFSTASGAGNAGQITVTAATLTLDDGGAISVATEGDGAAGSISLNVSNLTLAGGAQISSSTTGIGAGGAMEVTAGELVSISGAGSGFFSTASSTGNAGQITVAAAGSTPVPMLAIADDGKISVATSGDGNAGSISLNANTFSLTAGAQVVSSTTGAGQGGSVTVNAANSASISGNGTEASGLFSTAESTGSAGQIAVTTPTLAISNGGTISVATEGDGAAGNIVLSVSNSTLDTGAQITSSTSGAGAGGPLGLIASQSVSISGSGSGLFSTASSTGNAGQINVSAPGSTAVPTLTLADDGKISVATSGAGNAGSVSLNANTLNLTGGAQVVSSTAGAGQGGSIAITANNSTSISGSRSGLLSTASSTGNAGQVSVTTPALTMGDGGTISVVTSGVGNAGNIALNVNSFTQTNGARVESSTDGSGAGGTLGLTANELVSISGAGSGLFSTASGTGDAGQITLAAAGAAPVPTLTMSDGGKISVATSGAGNAGSVSLNANTLNLTGGAQVVSSTDGAGQGGSIAIAANNSTSISDSQSGLFSTASSTGNAGQINLTTPTLSMENGGTISVATSGAGNAGNIALNVTNFTQTGGATVDSSTTGGGQGGDLTITAANSATISDPGTGLFSTASGAGAGGDVNLQAGNIQLLNGGTISANSTGTVTATAGNVNIVYGDTFSMVGGSITTGADVADGGSISITATGSMLQMTDSQITTSVGSGDGSGGNITIGSEAHPFDFILLNDSQIRADAFGGPGGNINIFANVYLTSNSIVSASSALSTPGAIAIEATFTDVSGSVAQLPETPLQATELLRAACAARFAGGKASSLVLGGRDGLPIQPGGLLPSPLYIASNAAAPATSGYDPPLRFSLLGSNDRGFSRYSLLANARCSL